MEVNQKSIFKFTNSVKTVIVLENLIITYILI